MPGLSANAARPFGQRAGCSTFADNINARIMHLFL
jgi:hypothetical protein